MNIKGNANITVIDTIMGSGKTSYAIQMMSEAKELQSFIYITPFLSEVERIKTALPEKNFLTPTPSNRKGSKLEGLKILLRRGENIVSTHALFKRCDEEVIELLKSNNYILILDECMDVVEQMNIEEDDINILFKSNTIIENERKWITWVGTDKDYCGVFKDVMENCFNNNIYHYSDKLYLWTFPVNIFSSFDHIYILTYMFDGQLQKYYFDIFGIQYNFRSVTKEDGRYAISEHKVKEDLSVISHLIHIYEGNLNDIGNDEYAFSVSYIKRLKSNPKLLKRTKDNIYNYFMHIVKSKSAENMWTTYKEAQNSLKGKGYTKGFVPCNSRATNEYRDKKAMVYIANRFTNPCIKQFFNANGVEIDEDKIALSELVQWIFRSAIRDGKEVYLYIPSKRMRNLLYEWLE
jgi:hypothetical protein